VDGGGVAVVIVRVGLFEHSLLLHEHPPADLVVQRHLPGVAGRTAHDVQAELDGGECLARMEEGRQGACGFSGH